MIGVIDVQSTEIAAFKEDELGILTTLANQVAVAIQNARLYRETQTALSEAEAQNTSAKNWRLHPRHSPDSLMPQTGHSNLLQQSR